MRDAAVRLFNQAQVMLRDCMGLQAGEELLILRDGTVSEDLVEASVYAAKALGANPVLMSFTPATYRPMKEYGTFTAASVGGESPPSFPRTVLAAIVASDRLLFATSDTGVFFFNPEVREKVRGHTGFRVNYFTTDSALRLLPESAEELREMAALTGRVKQLFVKARRARITSAAGTDITMSLGQNPIVRVADGIAPPGYQPGLGGQVSSIPDDGSAEGVVVIDRSIGANDYKELTETVTLKVERGNVTSVSGGADADGLRRFLADMNDPNIYHLTELGVGTNWRCRFTGVAAPVEDTHTLGCVSLAMGCDTHLGGKVNAGAHIDMTMRAATLELDGELVIKEGKLLVV